MHCKQADSATLKYLLLEFYVNNLFLWPNAWFSCIDGVAGIMPIITCPSCNSTNPRFCRKTGLVTNTRLFGFIWCRLLRRHLGFDSDYAQISGLKIGGWQHCSQRYLQSFPLKTRKIDQAGKSDKCASITMPGEPI